MSLFSERNNDYVIGEECHVFSHVFLELGHFSSGLTIRGRNYLDHKCGLRRNKSTTDHILCICEIREKKMRIQWGSASGIYKLQDSL